MTKRIVPGIPSSLLVGLLTLVVSLLLSVSAAAQTPTCNALKGAKKTLAMQILRSQHPYACCTDTIANCLKSKPKCSLPRMLADQVCRAAQRGQDRATIERGLAERAKSMTSTHTVPINLRHAERAGAQDARVTVVAYVCARCPFCSKLMPKLHKCVTEGALKGKVKLYFKEFPIRSHPASTEGGLAVLAAQKMHSGWKYLLHLYEVFDSFDVSKLGDYAASLGLDRAKFMKLLKSHKIRKALVRSKKEGVRNDVNATPTLFIDGRKYTGPLDFPTVKDVLLEAAENKK